MTIPAPIRIWGQGNVNPGETDLLATHEGVPRNGTVTGIIYSHSLGAQATEMLRGNPYTPYMKVCRRLLKAGLPMLATDLGSTTNCGNPLSSTRITEAHAYMQARLGVRPDRLLLLGVSMGALAALNYAKANPGLVRGVGLIFPLMDMADSALTPYAATFDAAYGSNSARVAAYPTRNPATYASGFPTPTQILYSTADPVTRPGPITAFASAAAATTATALASAGPHFDADVTDAEAAGLADFLIGRA